MSGKKLTLSRKELFVVSKNLLPNKMPRKLLSTNRLFLLRVYNQILSSGFVPSCWKIWIILPIIKSGKPRSKNAPTGRFLLLFALTKSLSEWYTRLTWFTESKNKLRKFQSSFRQNRSKIYNIIALEQRIRKGWRERKKKLSPSFWTWCEFLTEFGFQACLRNWPNSV